MTAILFSLLSRKVVHVLYVLSTILKYLKYNVA